MAEKWPGGLQPAASPLSKSAAQAAAAAAAEGPHGAEQTPSVQQAWPAGAEMPNQVVVEAGAALTARRQMQKGGLLERCGPGCLAATSQP